MVCLIYLHIYQAPYEFLAQYNMCFTFLKLAESKARNIRRLYEVLRSNSLGFSLAHSSMEQNFSTAAIFQQLYLSIVRKNVLQILSFLYIRRIQLLYMMFSSHMNKLKSFKSYKQVLIIVTIMHQSCRKSNEAHMKTSYMYRNKITCVCIKW